jgi:hypothetical protein
MTTIDNVSHPDIKSEKEKCLKFLNEFRIGVDWFKYREQLQEIVNRDRKVLEIDLTDIINFLNNTEFENNIKENTLRYVKLFEEAGDIIMEPLRAEGVYDKDIFDILQEQTLAQRELYVDPNEIIPNNQQVEPPKELTRRYLSIHTSIYLKY